MIIQWPLNPLIHPAFARVWPLTAATISRSKSNRSGISGIQRSQEVLPNISHKANRFAKQPKESTDESMNSISSESSL